MQLNGPICSIERVTLWEPRGLATHRASDRGAPAETAEGEVDELNIGAPLDSRVPYYWALVTPDNGSHTSTIPPAGLRPLLSPFNPIY